MIPIIGKSGLLGAYCVLAGSIASYFDLSNPSVEVSTGIRIDVTVISGALVFYCP